MQIVVVVMHVLQMANEMLTSQAYSLVLLDKSQASELVEGIQISTVFAVLLIISQLGNQDIVEQSKRLLYCCGSIKFNRSFIPFLKFFFVIQVWISYSSISVHVTKTGHLGGDTMDQPSASDFSEDIRQEYWHTHFSL